MTRKKPAAVTPPPEVRRCAIYTRKSTSVGLDSDFNSLDAQREACAAYIERQQGWRLVEEHYDDGGFTGANTDRPAFQRLMADVEAKRVDVIVVYKVDRLSRSLLDFVKVMEQLNAAGASFVSVTQNFSTADAMGRLTMNLLASFAEFEREMIRERTRDKIAASRRRGKWTGGPTPFGYKLVEKKLVIDDVEAHVVRELFRLFLEHRQMAKVAQLLNDQALLPRGMKGRPGKHGLLWRKESVARILRSPVYVGQVPYHDEVHAGEHQALVDDETFQKAQRILDGKPGHFRQTGLNPDYVLRGLIRCKRCDGAMCPGSTTRGERQHRYYRCSTRDRHGIKACSARPLPAEAIERFVVERIARHTTEGGFVPHVEQLLHARTESRRATAEQLRAELPAKIAAAADQAKRLSEQATRLKGRARELVEAQLVVESDRLLAAEKQLTAVNCDLEELAAERTVADWVIDALRNFARVWDLLTPENKGRLLRILVAQVRVDEDKGVIEVELAGFTSPETKEAA